MDPLKVIAVERRRQILELIWLDSCLRRHRGPVRRVLAGDLPAPRRAQGGRVRDRTARGTIASVPCNPEAMGQLRAVIESMWQSRLDDLKALVEAEPGNQEDQ